ncbi:MAG: MOSC N-terminal beta barrel domain-containing protein [Pseudomonadota bacterium]|nr:MOSC N-terminal beta barrel domain-containing protein [Pseudomonadota bacterium]
MNEANDVAVTVQSVHVYPVKSCAGLAPAEALLVETGFDLDRAWMVTDGDFEFVTQRELPRMALVHPTLKGDEMILRAPGMLALHVALERVEARCQARVWKDRVEAYDMGSLCAHWFSDFLGRPLRLVRFDPEQKRLADHNWTGPIDAETALQDGYPLLVASTASLAEMNRRLVVAGEEQVTMARFRPNIVLDGLDAHGEDHLDEIVFDTADGPVRLKLVKPCGRCPIPDVEPATGIGGHAVGDVLQQYRADARLGGALTFGMNAVIVEGFGCNLGVGLSGRAGYRFD